jgi:hypothetical protein
LLSDDGVLSLGDHTLVTTLRTTLFRNSQHGPRLEKASPRFFDEMYDVGRDTSLGARDLH